MTPWTDTVGGVVSSLGVGAAALVDEAINQERGVPAGHNVARILAVDLDRIALDLDNIQVAMAVGRFDKVTGTWNQTLRDLSAMRTQCSA